MSVLIGDQFQAFTRKQIDETVINWLSKNLGCLPGRLEFNKGRMRYHIFEQNHNFRYELDESVRCLKASEIVSAIYFFPRIVSPNVLETSVNLFKIISHEFPEANTMSRPVSLPLELTCPVSKSTTWYFDFDFVAFCPQAINIHDPLYNPSIYSPYPAINFSSDIYGFSIFVADLCEKLHHTSVPHLTEIQKNQLFNKAISAWQRLALNTMKNFSQPLNSERQCPIHVSDTGRYWLSAHSDSSFHSERGNFYIQKMPILYARQIVELWKEYFASGTAIDYRRLAENEEKFFPAHGRIRDIEE